MSKNTNISEFDKFIQQSLEGAKVPAPTGVFEGISAATTAASTAGKVGLLAKVGGIKTLIIGASVALVATVTTVTLTKQADKDATQTTQQSEVEQSNADQTAKDNADNSGIVLDESGKTGSNADLPADTNSTQNSYVVVDNDNSNNTNSNNADNVIDGQDQDVERDNSQDNGSDKTEMAPLDFELSKTEICRNESCTVAALPNKDKIDFYWMVDGVKHFNKTSIELVPSSAGSIQISLISFPNGKKETISKTLYVHESKAKVEAKKVQEGLFDFKTSQTFKSYKWEFEEGKMISNDARPRHYFDTRKTAISKVILWTVNDKGCKDSVHARVSLVEAPKIANTITPYDPDGLNDRFIIPIEHETYYKLLVYNGLGEVIFESSSKEKTWDGTDMNSGKMVQPGSYRYKFVYRQVGGSKTTKQGTIYLLK